MSGRFTHVRAALVEAVGRGLDCRVRVRASAQCQLDDSIRDRYAAVASGNKSPAAVAYLARHLAVVQANMVRQVSSQAPDLGVNQVLLMGVHEAGFWHEADGVPIARLGICDTAALAHATGISVVDAFPDRDLAQGGRGGPVEALAQWVLLHDAKQQRVLVDLGRTIRLTYLPASSEAMGADRVIALEVGPGLSLTNTLARQLTEGKHDFDPGGRLAVQGRQVPELLSNFQAGSESEKGFPIGTPPDRPTESPTKSHVHASVAKALDARLSLRDVLCTATHYIAESVARCITERIPKRPPLAELVVTGGGEQNGFLLREIAGRLPELSLVRIGDLGYGPHELEPAAVAVLAILHIDQVPQTHTSISGTPAPRVLGRLTPGSPQNWQRLVRHIAENQPKMMALRSAI